MGGQLDEEIAQAWGDYLGDHRETANGLCALADRMIERIDAALVGNARKMREVAGEPPATNLDDSLDLLDQLWAEADRVIRGEDGKATTMGLLTALAIGGAICAGAVCVTWFGERGGWPRSLVGLMIVVALACVIVADFRAWDRRTALAKLEHHMYETGCPLCASFEGCPIADRLSREANLRGETCR